MRQIILDTETTGLDPDKGHRIVELGCVEMLNRQLTGNNLHLYFNPERDSEPEALQVHGLTTEFLRKYQRFGEQAQQIIDYLKGAELIIHNASFDVGFLNAEFKRSNKPCVEDFTSNVIDSLAVAREMFPGKYNNLDALCGRFSISNEHRKLHGALLDAQLLSEVWLAMTRGQFDLLGNMEDAANVAGVGGSTKGSGVQTNYAAQADSTDSSGLQTAVNRVAHQLPVIYADADELKAHQAYVDILDKAVDGLSLWHRYSSR